MNPPRATGRGTGHLPSWPKEGRFSRAAGVAETSHTRANGPARVGRGRHGASERRGLLLHYLAARAAAAAAAGFVWARVSSQMVIGAAMNQVEYVPEMMPKSIAIEKSKMVPTP